MTEQLVCPKCHGAMRRYERSDVHVDQCSECRGIFLDRGELEQLIDAEQQWHGQQQAAPSVPTAAQAPPPAAHPSGSWHSGGRREWHSGGRREWFSGPRGYEGRGYKRGKRSFLDDLFG